jgi:hypothetical protein
MNMVKKPTILIWLFIVAGLIGVYFVWTNAATAESKQQLDSLFSGFAFVGLIGTIFLQMQELRETREQLAKSAAAQVESEKALREQLRAMEATALINAYTAMLQYESTPAAINMGNGLAGAIKINDKLKALVRSMEIVHETGPKKQS